MYVCCVCDVHVWTHMPCHTSRGQRTISQSLFSPSTFSWDPDIELRPACLYSDHFHLLSFSLAPHILPDAVIFEHYKTLDFNFKMSMGLMFADMHNRGI